MPIARSSVLWAHVLTSVAANLVSVAVVIGVALIMGFRTGTSIATWLAVAGMLILFTLALTWLAVIAGLSAKTVDGASAFSYPLIFLPFISSAFVPTSSMPGWSNGSPKNQPVTSIVNTIRALFAQQPVGSDIWTALAWLVGILAVAYAFAIAIYRRKISKSLAVHGATDNSNPHIHYRRRPPPNSRQQYCIKFACGSSPGTPRSRRRRQAPVPTRRSRSWCWGRIFGDADQSRWSAMFPSREEPQLIPPFFQPRSRPPCFLDVSIASWRRTSQLSAVLPEGGADGLTQQFLDIASRVLAG